MSDQETPTPIADEVPNVLGDEVPSSPADGEEHPATESDGRLRNPGETIEGDDAPHPLPPGTEGRTGEEPPAQAEQPNAHAPEDAPEEEQPLDFGPYEPVPGTPAQEQPTWQQRFIAALRITPVVGTACRVAGRGRTRVYHWKGRDKLFAAAWTSALEDGADRLEQAVIERAVKGTEEVYRTYHPLTAAEIEAGRVQGAVKTERRRIVFNDRGAEFMLKAVRPEKYRERFEVRQTDDSSIDADIRQLDEEMRQMSKAAGDPPVPSE